MRLCRSRFGTPGNGLAGEVQFKLLQDLVDRRILERLRRRPATAPPLMTDPATPRAYVRFRDVSPALEFCAWTMLLLTPLLRVANGLPVTPDQRSFQILVVIGALLAAVVLRLYNWRTTPDAETTSAVAELEGDFAATASRQRLEKAIREDPDDPSNYVELARLLSTRGQLDEAQQTLEVAANYCAQQEAVRRQLDVVHQLRIERTTAQGYRDEKPRRVPAGISALLRRIPWLESVLGIAAAALFFRFFPGAWALLTAYFGGTIATTVFLANIALLALLIGMRRR